MADRVGTRVGNYRLERLLGKGGFAEVYLGVQVYLGTRAAVKLLHAPLASEQEIEQFRQEARTIARLDHPQIVRVLDFGLEGDLPYLLLTTRLGGACESFTPLAHGCPWRQWSPMSSRLLRPSSTPTTSTSSIATSSQRTCSWGVRAGCC